MGTGEAVVVAFFCSSKYHTFTPRGVIIGYRMYIVKYSERVHMARMREHGYFTIDSAPIYNIQDHPAFHFALVNVKTIISSALAGYSCSSETPPIGAKW